MTAFTRPPRLPMKMRFFQCLLAATICLAAGSANAAPDAVLKPWPAKQATPALRLESWTARTGTWPSCAARSWW
jgi:hypothetical protein